jgi:hypothetical protein
MAETQLTGNQGIVALAMIAPPTGTDGYPPIWEPDGMWRTLALQELYMGKEGKGRYVGKVNDYVTNYETDARYKVIALDLSTLIPTLEKIKPAGDGSFSEADLLLGVGPGTQADTYRIFINSNVRPPTLTVDQRLSIKGTESITAMIFLGTDLTPGSKLLGMMYDASGNLMGPSIPLELVKESGFTNYTEKTVKSCYATQDVEDGEVVTVVFYSASGRVTSKRQLLVENTAFVRAPDVSQRYIVGIELQSPFMSPSDPNVLEYPLNVPLNGLNMYGVVHYSDGKSMRRPVDGTKFRIDGLEPFLSTQIGQQFPLVLNYALSADEVQYGPDVRDPNFMAKDYMARTVKAEGQYTVKLFGYPVWIDQVNGYRLEWYLYNLDRSSWTKCSGNVRISENSPTWNPLGYGTNQQLRVEVNLKDVNGIYKDYLHTQIISFVLMRPAVDTEGTNWTVSFDPGQNPAFGRYTVARTTFVNQNFTTLRLDAGTSVWAEWLSRVYKDTRPLVDRSKEVDAPEPNFFIVMAGDAAIEFPISQWNSDLTINRPIADASTLFVRFIKRTAENDLQLGVTGFAVHQNR